MDYFQRTRPLRHCAAASRNHNCFPKRDELAQRALYRSSQELDSSNLKEDRGIPRSIRKHSALLLLEAAGFLGCGAGHANLQSISVSPQSATASSSRGQVEYTATGNFANGKSRELSQVEGAVLEDVADEYRHCGGHHRVDG